LVSFGTWIIWYKGRATTPSSSGVQRADHVIDIADKLSEKAAGRSPKQSMRKLLVLNFFPALTPPASGGECRHFYLYSRLAARFDVTLLSPGFPNQPRDLVVHSPTFREHRIPKAPVHDGLHQKLAEEGITEECSALVCSLAARIPNDYHDAYL